ncbi:MAG: hypothetical protein ACQEP8_05670 [Chlamydiota bacterium]
MKKSKALKTAFFTLITCGIATGCVGPGEFGGANYHQESTQTYKTASKVTVLTFSDEAQKNMLNKSDVTIIGKSKFNADSDSKEDFNLMKKKAKAQAKVIGANVVLLSRIDEGQKEKVRTERITSDSQKAIEDAFGNSYLGKNESSSRSESKTTYEDANTKTTKTSKESVDVSVGASIADITSLIPGQVKYKDVKYKVDVYQYHAIFLRDPDYPGISN